MDKKLGGLEIARAIAALAVMAGHMRGMYFVDYNDLEYKSVIAQIFYFLTGFGHQSVIVFFVLSGFLVGGSVIEKFEKGTWSWKKYLTQRLARLWIVLIPSLLFTLFFDILGLNNNYSLYQGTYYNIMHSGPIEGTYFLSLNSFLGNLFFLHGWITPIFGSNGPMWSLFNEFWYYLIFPLFCGTVFRKNNFQFISNSLILFAIFAFIPNSIIEGFFYWIIGALVAKTMKSQTYSFNLIQFVFGLFVFLISLFLSRHIKLTLNDSFTAFSFCIFIIPLSLFPYRFSLFSFLSDCSYSVYLLHFSFSLFISSFYLPHRHQFDLNSFLIFSCYVLICFAYCVVMYFCFEYHTPKLRKFIDLCLSRKSTPGQTYPSQSS